MQRILLSWGANQYVRRVTDLQANDCTSGYRLFKREALEAMDLGSVTSNGYSFQVEMAFRAHQAGFHIVEVPIVFTERRSGHSKMSRGVIWESILVPLKLRRGVKRSRLAPEKQAAAPLQKVA